MRKFNGIIGCSAVKNLLISADIQEMKHSCRIVPVCLS